MEFRIVRSVVFTTAMGRVLNADKRDVADFLGSDAHEEEFSRLGYEASREILGFIRSITPEGKRIQLYQCPSGLGGGAEECVLAEVETVY